MDKQRAKAIKRKASAQKRDRKPSAFNQIMGDPADILLDQEGIVKQAKEFGVGGADETAVMKYVKEIAKDDFVDEQLPLIQSRRARGGKYRLD